MRAKGCGRTLGSAESGRVGGVVLRTRLALAKSFATVSVGCAPTDSLRNTRTHKGLAADLGAAIGR